MPRVELFAFHYRDPRTGRWIRARYRAERHEIASRHAEFEIIGAPEIRDVDPDERHFTPHERGGPLLATSSQLAGPLGSGPVTVDPGSIRGVERFLLLLFLRRYVTYCARRRRYSAMNGAARLHTAIMRA